MILAASMFPSTAIAAPAAYFDLPGSSNEWLGDLTAAPDGTLWVSQSLSTGPSNSERHMRMLRIGSNGSIVATSETQEGDPHFSGQVPAADGGVWVLSSGGAAEHIAPDGSVDTFDLPPGYPVNLTAGRDSRAWVQSCTTTYGESHEEHCKAIAISMSGDIDSFDLTGVSTRWPPGVTEAGGFYRGISTTGGVWFSKLFSYGDGPGIASADFISYDGQDTAVTLPSEARLVGDARGDAVWWRRNERAAGATIGLVSSDGIVSSQHHLSSLSLLEDSFTAAPGRDGNLIWAQNATWNDEYDGQIGLALFDGGNTSFKVEQDATAVPTSTPNWWSGSCTFGAKLYQAADGALWTISTGHPARITRQELSGTFSTFLLGNRADTTDGQGTGIWGMVETDPHSLWFTLDTPSGPQLARIDPLDPPPAEPRMARHESTESTESRGSGRHRRILMLIQSLIGQMRRALSKAPQADSSRLHGGFPAAGTVTVLLEHRKGGHFTVLASGKANGPAGRHSIPVRYRNGVRRLLHDAAKTRAALSVSFEAHRGENVARVVRIRL